MKPVFPDISKLCLKIPLLFFLMALCTGIAGAQTYRAPVLPDTSQLGRYTSRTMNLLHFSTPESRNEVKILVYGQSISEQDWWLEVRRSVKERFPDADLVMENRAIGGFSTQYLWKTVEMDVNSFYPDLVLLHVYGGNEDYEKVLRSIRSRTASEVAIMTDHYTGENKWSDSMSYHILPVLAEKYKCDIINIRDPWKRYLRDNNLEPSALLSDGTHLNDYGNYLMAELVKPLFCYKSHYPADPFGLLTILKQETDQNNTSDTFTARLTGNRADLVLNTAQLKTGDTLDILLDGYKPSSFPGTYFMTRPFSSNGRSWPWELPAMISVGHTEGWLSEEWSLVYTKAEPPFTDFSFSIAGSVTGDDGKGKGSEDFVSNSGRVIISKNDAENDGDWHLNRSYKVLKTTVHKGDTVKWKTYTISRDLLVSDELRPSADKVSIILFQGVPSADHVLRIISRNGCSPPVEMVKVYRPYWNR